MELRTPIECKSLRDLKVGDLIYVTGEVITARDLAHTRILEHLEGGKPLPFEINRAVIYHCGPLMKFDGKWKVISAGPTTSARMNEMTRKILRYVDCMVIIGKGGMNVEFGGKGVYLSYTGGCGALASKYIKNVNGVHWLDLGMAEAVWVLEVEKFPCIVTIDSSGNNLYEYVKRKVDDNYKRLNRTQYDNLKFI